jgi:hypothetical protein
MVFKNGVYQMPGIDFLESTSTTFAMVAEVGFPDVIIAVGFVGLTGTVTAHTNNNILSNALALKTYISGGGSETSIYVPGTVVANDGGEGWYHWTTSAADPGTYVESTGQAHEFYVILPAGGDGSQAWLRQTPSVTRRNLELETISQAEAEAGTATTTRTWNSLRVRQAISAGITAIATGAFIKGLYEAEANTNVFTDAEKTKLGNLAEAASAEIAEYSIIGDTLGSGSEVVLQFNTALISSGAMNISNHRYTPTVQGTYYVELEGYVQLYDNPAQSTSPN